MSSLLVPHRSIDIRMSHNNEKATPSQSRVDRNRPQQPILLPASALQGQTLTVVPQQQQAAQLLSKYMTCQLGEEEYYNIIST